VFDVDQDYPWDVLDGAELVSDEGSPSLSRNTVTYPIDPPLGYDQFFAVIQTAFNPVKGTTISMVLRWGGGLFVADAGSLVYPSPAYGIRNDYWPEGHAVPPNTIYIPPTAVLVPAVWGDL